jgi:Ca-activated chloride channel family protein
MPPNMRDHYAVLGVVRGAAAEDIKRAYHAAARRFHPDRNMLPGETEVFLEVQRAYEVLSHPQRRAQYDATLPPEDAQEVAPVQLSVKYSRASLVRLDEPQLLYALLEASAADKEGGVPAAPLNACLVLDRSTSMKGEKMDVAKASAIRILRMLRPEDRFGLVVFSDHADVLLPSGHQRDLKNAESRIQSMQASGATEMYRGLEAGLAEVRRSIAPGRANHLILITDGHTYGDEQECLKLAGEAARLNVSIGGFGLGSDWNDIFMDSLAGRTGGNSNHASAPHEIEAMLVSKFKSLARTVVENVAVDFEPRPGVQLRYCYRLQPEGGPVDIGEKLHLGPILSDMTLNVVFEFMIESAASKSGTVTLLDSALSAVGGATPSPAMRLRMERPVQVAASAEPPPQSILSALSRLALYRLQERAQQEAAAGEYESATRHLRNLARQLQAQGHNDLAKTTLLEAESIERLQAHGGQGGKDIKYGTRALMKPAVENGK